MDQLKEVLRQMIIYRFWISAGLAALLPMIGYFVAVGPIQAKADAEAAAIKSADADVKKYTSGDLPNNQYKPIVAEKTEILTKDVDNSWRKLYQRQAPLLTWPSRVQDRFTKWGRQWPKDVDSGAVRFAIIDYINAYPGYVNQVYQSFRPFDSESGKGVVFAPPEAMLLRPAQFDLKELPDLGKVWAAQERLWIQRTLLDVVAQVNGDAKTWDEAKLKQINALEVGTPIAQDQRSIAKGETLEEAAAIDDPSKPAEAPADTSAGPMAGAMPPGMMGMMGSGRATTAPETVSYIHTDSSQFKMLPVKMDVLIEQDRIQDFLIALANSPMTIECNDFEMAKPEARVTKPEKGQQMAGMMMGGMGGMPGMGGMGSMMMGGMTGFGGRSMMGGMGGMMPGMGGMGAMYGMGSGAGGGGVAKKGVDKRSEDLAKKRQDELKKIKETKAVTLNDPYFNVVEVTIYGRARFFNPPPEAPAAEPASNAPETPADVAKPAEGEKKAEGEAAKKAEAEKKAEPEKKAEGEAEKKAGGEAEKKAEPEKKAEGEAEKKAEPEKKPEAESKPDASKKTDAPKSEAPETAAPKSDPSSAPAPKK
jgi:hypothetical protein